MEQSVYIDRSSELWSETFAEKWVRRVRTCTNGVELAKAIQNKRGMDSIQNGAIDPLAYSVKSNPSGLEARVNQSINIELEPINLKAALMEPTRRYQLIRRALRALPPRSKVALEARINRGFGAGHDPIGLVSELAGQPSGLSRLYGALTWNGASESTHTVGSPWGPSHQPQPQPVSAITGQMLDDYLIRSLQTTLIVALLDGR